MTMTINERIEMYLATIKEEMLRAVRLGHDFELTLSGLEYPDSQDREGTTHVVVFRKDYSEPSLLPGS